MIKKDNFFFTVFLLYIFVILYLLFNNDLSYNYSRFLYQDKLIHFAAFFAGQVFALFSGIRANKFRKTTYLIFLLLPIVSEMVQGFLSTRVSDLWDMVAAYIGIIMCIVIYKIIKLAYK